MADEKKDMVQAPFAIQGEEVDANSLGNLRHGLEDDRVQPRRPKTELDGIGIGEELTRTMESTFRSELHQKVPDDVHLEVHRILAQLIPPHVLLKAPPDDIHYLVQAVSMVALDFQSMRNMSSDGGSLSLANLEHRVRAHPVVRNFMDMHHHPDEEMYGMASSHNPSSRPSSIVRGNKLHHGNVIPHHQAHYLH